MKLKSIYSRFCIAAVATMSTVWFTSCVNDDVLRDSENQQNYSDTYFSIKVRMPHDNASRADETSNPNFSDGVDAEQLLDPNGEHLMIYFDNKWQYAGFEVMKFVESDEGNPYNIESTFVCKLPTDKNYINSLPEHALMVINGYNMASQLSVIPTYDPSFDITNILNFIEENSETHKVGRVGKYFTMTSSAYLVKSSGNWVHNMAFDLDKSNFFDNEAEAKANPVGIAFVERMLCKFTANFEGGTGSYGLNYTPANNQIMICKYYNGVATYLTRTWNMTVTGWGIGGTEQSSYIFKNIVKDLPNGPDQSVSEGTGGDEDVPSTSYSSRYRFNFGANIDEKNAPFYPGWNSPENYRSFWAIDPHYPDGYYPLQYRVAVDNGELDFYEKDDRVLDYISYNELEKDLSKNMTKRNAMAPIYTPENTFPDDTQNQGRWQYSYASTHLIVGAKMHIQGADETDLGFDIYRDRTGIFYPTIYDFMSYFVNTFNGQLMAQNEMTYKYYNWEDPFSSDPSIGSYKNVNFGGIKDYRLCYNGEVVTPEMWYSVPAFYMAATIEGGDGKVIPWIPGMYIARVDSTTGKIGDRFNISDNDFKSLIYEWLGSFDHFNQGAMYYLSRVRHNATSEMAGFDGYKPTVGDYGVVRNHWYELDVKSFNSLGTPVDDLDQKIIPYEAELDNSLIVEIKVLNWHLFQTEIQLPNQPQ